MISVDLVIPCWDEGEWLRTTLKSIKANAGYDNYRILVCDDGSTDNSVEIAKEEGATVIMPEKHEELGTGRARNRGLRASTADLIITVDAHMVFSPDFVKKFVDLHRQYPKAIIQGTTTGYWSAQDEQVVPIPFDGKNFLELAEKVIPYIGQPAILTLPKEHLKDHDAKRKLINLLQVPVRAGDRCEIHLKNHMLDMNLPDGHFSAGAILEFDPEDRNFITPKWVPWHNKKYLLNSQRSLFAVNGVMGACYMIPRKLFLDRIGGWTDYGGWVHEEEMFIAWLIQDMPILSTSTIIAAHNYDRVKCALTNEENKENNKWAITYICFEDMVKEIQGTIFTGKKAPDFPDWVHEYRGRVQSYRAISDKQFLYENNLEHYFIPKEREKVSKRLGLNTLSSGDGSGIDLSKVDIAGVRDALDRLAQNPDMKYMAVIVNMVAGMKKTTEQTIWLWLANEWDEKMNKRSNLIHRAYHDQMIGRVQKILTMESGKAV